MAFAMVIAAAVFLLIGALLAFFLGLSFGWIVVGALVAFAVALVLVNWAYRPLPIKF